MTILLFSALALITYLASHRQLVSNIVLDTSTVATDTIDYVAADSAGLTSTSTRTVLIEPVVTPPAAPRSDSTTTDATSTI